MRSDVLLTVRLWRDEGGAAPWRVRLTDLRTGAAASFPDLDALLRYLGTRYGDEAEAPDDPDAD